MAREIRAFGYHGTSRANTEKFLAGEFLPHSQPGDWLGDGMYFWQDGPERAWEWAREKHPTEPFVVGAEIILNDQDCIDLLDILWEHPLLTAYEAFAMGRQLTGKGLPRQTEKFHGLDRVVINVAAKSYRERGVAIRAVRAAFQEGAPIFPGSALHNRSHVQIAVRDPSLIMRRWPQPART